MKIKMELLSDTIFGNGRSVPGGEDIAVLHDEKGFPYFRGSTIKGVFREELERCLSWQGKDAEGRDKIIKTLGISGDNRVTDDGKLIFADFHISENVKQTVIKEVGDKPTEILGLLTNIRTFTKIEDGMVENGSLRTARCVNKGLIFYSTIQCDPQDEKMVGEVLSLIKWIGTMRSRGFGKVRMSVI